MRSFSRVVLSLLALVLTLSLAGCNTKAPTLLAPSGQSFPAGLPAGGVWKWVDATHISYTYQGARWDARLQRVIIGPITVVGVCDYPTDFNGPIPSGHCRTDGSGCNLSGGSAAAPFQAMHPLAGDPTADD